MAYFNPFVNWQTPGMYPSYTPQPVPDQLAQMRGAMPYQPAAQQMQQQGNGVLWVQGEAGARGYMIAPNQSLLLMDSERPSFYLKTADQSGVPSMRIFDYTERTAQAPAAENAAQYATREEVAQLRAQLDALTRQQPRAGRRTAREEDADEQPAV